MVAGSKYEPGYFAANADMLHITPTFKLTAPRLTVYKEGGSGGVMGSHTFTVTAANASSGPPSDLLEGHPPALREVSDAPHMPSRVLCPP